MLIENITFPIQRIKGIGDETLKSFGNLGIYSLGDLLLHFPSAYEDRITITPLAQAYNVKFATCLVEVQGHDFLQLRSERVLKVIIRDTSGQANLICFGRNFLQNTLAVGQKFYLYGNFQFKYNEIQCSSFECEPYSEQPENFKKIIPIYRLSGALKQNKVRKFIHQALEMAPETIDFLLPQKLLSTISRQNKKAFLQDMHFPISWDAHEQAGQILLMEELYSFQIAMCQRRSSIQKQVRKPLSISKNFFNAAKLRLPFDLTSDQEQAIEEIFHDLSCEHPMRRLLQGDVGTGKTLVAFLAACPLLEEGRQVALMAPTELLARQHADNAAQLLEPLGIHVAFLTSNIRSKQRKHVLENLANGQIQLVVGTHALFTADVHYANLSLIIIDEQHRFGVSQRDKLLAKGKGADLLLMSATPIPRTLALSLFGDLDVSELCVYPKGRLSIKTHMVQTENIARVHQFVLGQLQAGHQAYYVYPLIEESEENDIRSAENVYAQLSKEIFKDYRVGLIHARLDEEEKRKVMLQFSQGHLKVLVATSIVEVGVDVANATVMVIESAERFGLAALHQLRGRVGRSHLQSYCFFVYTNLSEEGKQRMKIIYENLDGFVIAQQDLHLRGPGEFTGFRQSGSARFRLADLQRDEKIFLEMRDVAIAAFNDKDADPVLMDYLKIFKKKDNESLV